MGFAKKFTATLVISAALGIGGGAAMIHGENILHDKSLKTATASAVRHGGEVDVTEGALLELYGVVSMVSGLVISLRD